MPSTSAWTIIGILTLCTIPALATPFVDLEEQPSSDAKSVDPSKTPVSDTHLRPSHDRVADSVQVTLDRLTIHSVDESEEKVLLELSLRLAWEDKRLLNHVERGTVFGGQEIPNVWIPELMILPSSEQMIRQGKSLYLDELGNVAYSESILAKISCESFSFLQPWERQDCKIKIVPKGYSSLHLTLFWNGSVLRENLHLHDSRYSTSVDQANSIAKLPNGAQMPVLEVSVTLKKVSVHDLFWGFILPLVISGLAYILTFFWRRGGIETGTDPRKGVIVNESLVQKQKSGSESQVDIERVEEASLSASALSVTKVGLGVKASNLRLTDHPVFVPAVKISVNCFLFLVLILLKILVLVKSSRRASFTGLDLLIFLMCFNVLACFLVSIFLDFRQESASSSSRDPEDRASASRRHKCWRVLRLSLPLISVLYVLMFILACIIH